MDSSEQIVQVSRGLLVESYHKGHIAIVNNSGDLLYSLGNPYLRTYARSTVKPFQALAVVECGAVDTYQFTPQEIAILCSSHNGEPNHITTVENILNKLDLNPSSLLCSGVYDTCSGKHAGMLALAKHMKSSISNYTSRDHPVQQHMLESVCQMTDSPKTEVDMGIDGCGAPVFGLVLNRLAYAFACFGNPSSKLSSTRSESCERIRSAMIENPFFIAGTDQFDTRLIEVTKGRIIGKMGAEGIYALTVPSEQTGIAVKVEDGTQRALYPTVMETLKLLSLLTENELDLLGTFHNPVIYNRRHEQVGNIQPKFQLKAYQ